MERGRRRYNNNNNIIWVHYRAYYTRIGNTGIRPELSSIIAPKDIVCRVLERERSVHSCTDSRVYHILLVLYDWRRRDQQLGTNIH